MAPTREKNKVSRKWRSNTTREVEERRRKSLLKAGGRWQPSIRGGPPIAFDPPTADTISVAPATDGECINAPILDMPVDDDDVDVETVRAMEYICVDDLANEIAKFDDSAEDDDGASSSS
jgi:hypothetical protein